MLSIERKVLQQLLAHFRLPEDIILPRIFEPFTIQMTGPVRGDSIYRFSIARWRGGDSITIRDALEWTLWQQG